MTEKQLIKQLDRVVSGAHDADSNSPKRAARGQARLTAARDAIVDDFREYRAALTLARKSEQERDR